MRRSQLLLTALGACLVMISCAESTGPPLEAPRTMHILQWRETDSPLRFRANQVRASQGAAAEADVGAALVGPPLATDVVSFWAVRGEAQTVGVDYLATSYSEGAPFLTFDVPANALWRRPDGTPFVEGDSVLITLTVDTAQVLVRFEPTGLQFNPDDPVRLQIWYTGADEDLDADGDVDAADDDIEGSLLGVWYQEEESDPWTQMPATHSADEDWFTTYLFHFSGYTVSW